MDIKIKEPVYVRQDGNSYVVRPSTTGVEKDRVVYFPDVTRNVSVGFSRDFCFEYPQIFSVSRTMTDKEVSVKDVLKIVEAFPMGKEAKESLMQKLSEL